MELNILAEGSVMNKNKYLVVNVTIAFLSLCILCLVSMYTYETEGMRSVISMWLIVLLAVLVVHLSNYFCRNAK